jgi:DNA-3-methyladenine glycosylase II
MHHLTTLYPKPPWNFPLLLDVLSRFVHPTMDIVQDGAYWRVIRSGDGLALLRVRDGGTYDQPALQVDVMAQQGAVDPAHLTRVIAHVLHVDADRNAFIERCRANPAIWQVVEPLVGLVEWRTETLYEALVQTVIEQQIAWTAAQKAQRWLLEWVNDGLDFAGQRYYAWPKAESLAAATVDDLKPTRITFKRMALLIDLSWQVTSGELDLEAMMHLEPQAAYKQLTSIKGIGHWTAAVALERAFGHKDWVAYNDVVLQNATNRYWHGGVGRIPPEAVVETFAPFGTDAGLLAHYTMIRWVIDQYARRAEA